MIDEIKQTAEEALRFVLWAATTLGVLSLVAAVALGLGCVAWIVWAYVLP